MMDTLSDFEHYQQVFRPIQYLGNKLRSVSEITKIIGDLIGPQRQALDLFTGTSVVAQSLAHLGHKVTALDAQSYSYVMAYSLLGIYRKSHESISADMIVNTSLTEKINSIFSEWEPYVQVENDALHEGDYDRLKALYSALPLIWRANDHGTSLTPQQLNSGDPAFDQFPLMTVVQSGTYFGIRQSLEIDRIRINIEHAHSNGAISLWQKHALLTALMSAMSTAVHSAGKHFAQPLSAGKSRNFKFLSKRMLQDRNICIQSEFSKACEQVSMSARPADEGHEALQTTAEDFIERSGSNFDVIYADPPYTAQQYSRFYHLLETIINYEIPDLYHHGRVTTGLYPTNRFKSDFCSKRLAKKAFHGLVAGAKQRESSLIISYSKSSAKSTGNSRMISIDDLLSLCKREFGTRNVNAIPLFHRYRQFNSRSRVNEHRDDPEVLIVCRSK